MALPTDERLAELTEKLENNTGNEGWVYNDNVNDPKITRWLGELVGKAGEDLTRHDKWLCMMYPRLKLLHKLLADEGAIFISLDDNEIVYLRTIMDEIFGTANFIAQILEAGVLDKSPTTALQSENDYSRTSLASFLKKYGVLSEQDFVLFSAYFDEKKNGKKAFSIDDVKRYYTEARRAIPKNPSMSTFRLAEKGYIMDAPKPTDVKSGNYYMLTDEGISYIESYASKEDSGEKKKAHTKAKKSVPKISEAYVSITADDINAKKYPAVKSLSSSKERVIVAMYIVTNEGKGEWFTVEDVIHLLINVFEVPADNDKVNGVFKRNKSLFASEQDPINKKAKRKKLLSGAKDFAISIMQNSK